MYECKEGDKIENIFCSNEDDLRLTSVEKEFVSFSVGDSDFGQILVFDVDEIHVMCGDDYDYAHTVGVESVAFGNVRIKISNFDEVAYAAKQEVQLEEVMRMAEEYISERDKKIEDCEGCYTNDKCIPEGVYYEGLVCDGDRFVLKQALGSPCISDSQCYSDNCSRDRCIERNTWQRFVRWLKGLF
jgi:hypothetical protein